ncbi:TM2 domain-containing protein [Giardia muris]|uniref:TM2 domain-containing protein n=1 Tax=Giardia muris TaxID=5742 RepID=A0A4Z1SYU9_GIAMU|nr:TM2 domain-containing protein [Giardia muris]|eukprot:TNJ30650.1 TM2 domain-containing protein [Giardia muris]
MVQIRRRSILVCYVYWLFLGVFGGHQFYLYQYDLGFIYLFTAGIFLIGWVTDLFLIPLLVWEVNLIIDAINRQDAELLGEFGQETILHSTMDLPAVQQVYETSDDGPPN